MLLQIWPKEFYGWLCGFANSFPKLLEELFIKDWQWMQKSFYIYLVNGLNNNELFHEKLSSDEKQFAEIYCGQDQSFIFIPEKSKIDFEHLLVEARTIDHAIRWKVNGSFRGMNEWMGGVAKLYHKFKFEKQFELSMDDWPSPIQKAVQIIIQQLHEPLSSSYIANEVGLSRSHFSTLFSKSVGESFYTFTKKLKLNAASELLETTSLTLQEIGEKVGVHDGKYFSKWFKKCTGHTPSDYRQTKRRIHPDNLTPTHKIYRKLKHFY